MSKPRLSAEQRAFLHFHAAAARFALVDSAS
jgi:hypothetical protein